MLADAIQTPQACEPHRLTIGVDFHGFARKEFEALRLGYNRFFN